MTDVNAQLAHWEDLGEESRRLEARMTDIAELHDALEAQAKRIAELESLIVDSNPDHWIRQSFDLGFAKAIEMAVALVEEHRWEQAYFIRSAIKALKPPEEGE